MSTTVGVVAVDVAGAWIGGRYYLQHLIKATRELPAAERPHFVDVWWRERAQTDPFAEVRSLLGEGVVVRPPSTLAARAVRKVKRWWHASEGVGDLFSRAGVDVLFPIKPCERPGIPFVYWLPDFQHLHYPELFDDNQRQELEARYRTNVAQADRVVLSSRHALKDFERVFPESRSKSSLLHFCSMPDPQWWQLEPSVVARARGLPERFFLLSNQFSHHKNHLKVFQAVQVLRDRGTKVEVVCTGSTWGYRGPDYLERAKGFIAEHKIGDQIRILGLIPRAEQVALMRRSIAMLQPSLFEGWSTVVEDARTLGKTLLASRIEVHEEQLGRDYPYFASPHDVEEWVQLMGETWEVGVPGPSVARERETLAELAPRAMHCAHQFVAAMRFA